MRNFYPDKQDKQSRHGKARYVGSYVNSVHIPATPRAQDGLEAVLPTLTTLKLVKPSSTSATDSEKMTMATLFTKVGFLLGFSLYLTQLCLTAQITGINQITPINTTITYADQFSFSCLPLTTQLSDPIVSPGRHSSHTHVITGGTAFQRTMGTQTARNAHETACEVALDRSNYWVPALYHETDIGSFEMVEYEWSVCFSVCDLLL
jgi:uncharacterized Zn-binding protein involved in type VI secretion